MELYLVLETMQKVNPDVEIVKLIKKNMQRRQNDFLFNIDNIEKQ